ncbi:RNA polymerase sigma-70 factor [Ureibacillus acetophenoni]|uniref:RNA polymerase sigma-70 factor n=1 Tax=Ureibacillus acetophenoni TaxID=614649 RepID=A0A285UN75_9BACL|nr:RNA polymerase sigma-70 factor [Ureibacillus acetophenoni]SOC43272.1 RNA polymerase sigma-70 factor [Ureibacillus acetophenoni]
MQISNDEYKQLKPLLFSISYRMLGSISEAEDIVQETFLKAYQVDMETVESKKAYLCKMVTNRSLDVLRSARFRREQYIGPWNPEPLLKELDRDDDPLKIFLQKEGLSIAYLRMMEHLTPNERAVLVLREVFEFSYKELANIIEKSEDNCRKIFSRAKSKISRVDGESLHYEKNKSIVNRFIEAFQQQKTDTLLELLSENVTLYSDGGGVVRAAIRPISTLPNVSAFLLGILKKAPEDFAVEVKNVNGQPGIIIYLNGQLSNIISFFIVNERIEDIYMTLNPDKLPIGD